jgi:hypothetical protein
MILPKPDQLSLGLMVYPEKSQDESLDLPLEAVPDEATWVEVAKNFRDFYRAWCSELC